MLALQPAQTHPVKHRGGEGGGKERGREGGESMSKQREVCSGQKTQCTTKKHDANISGISGMHLHSQACISFRENPPEMVKVLTGRSISSSRTLVCRLRGLMGKSTTWAVLGESRGMTKACSLAELPSTVRICPGAETGGRE